MHKTKGKKKTRGPRTRGVRRSATGNTQWGNGVQVVELPRSVNPEGNQSRGEQSVGFNHELKHHFTGERLTWLSLPVFGNIVIQCEGC